MSKETTKAMARRREEDADGVYPWRECFKGRILDIGPGDDLLRVDGAEIVGFDKAQGDANRISQYFPAESFDAIHGSHVLEHLHNPKEALREWATLLKHGGFVVFTVPDIGAYEDFTYPSAKNPDHKASFSMIYLGSVFPIHCHIPTLLEEISGTYETLLARYVEGNLNWKERRIRDLTWDVNEACEMWNEVVLRKL